MNVCVNQLMWHEVCIFTKNCTLVPPNNVPTFTNIYLLLQNLDLKPLVVQLVTLLPHSLQQLCNALLLGLDHFLIGEENCYHGNC